MFPAYGLRQRPRYAAGFPSDSASDRSRQCANLYAYTNADSFINLNTESHANSDVKPHPDADSHRDGDINLNAYDNAFAHAHTLTRADAAVVDADTRRK